MYGINHRDNIFNGRFRLYVVDRIENESTARREYFASAQNLFPNFGGRSKAFNYPQLCTESA